MKPIPLTRGKTAWVDDCDYDYLSQFKWTFHESGYAIRMSPMVNGSRRHMIRMHREILGVTESEIVDHKNGDGLLNIRENLRKSTTSTNGMNRKRGSNNRTGFKGVHYHIKNKKFHATVMVNKRPIHLGCFDTAEEAAVAYANGARKYHGEFARIDNAN